MPFKIVFKPNKPSTVNEQHKNSNSRQLESGCICHLSGCVCHFWFVHSLVVLKEKITRSIVCFY